MVMDCESGRWVSSNPFDSKLRSRFHPAFCNIVFERGNSDQLSILATTVFRSHQSGGAFDESDAGRGYLNKKTTNRPMNPAPAIERLATCQQSDMCKHTHRLVHWK